jgi:hypothetical protein
VIGLPLGEAGPDGRARDMLVASQVRPWTPSMRPRARR